MNTVVGMGAERNVQRTLAFANAPVKRPETKAALLHTYTHSEEKSGRWQVFKTRMGGLLEDARDSFKRMKKGMEPVSKVERQELLVPAEVVMGQFGPVIISLKEYR